MVAIVEYMLSVERKGLSPNQKRQEWGGHHHQLSNGKSENIRKKIGSLCTLRTSDNIFPNPPISRWTLSLVFSPL